MYIERSIKEYLDDLAARKPAPGGGSAAALEAATGAALMSMVANFTISNKKYADVKDIAEDSLAKSEALRQKLMELVDEDVEAYKKVALGVKTIEKGSKELDALYVEACRVPLEICRAAGDAMILCVKLVEFGNKNLITDTAIAAIMLESAFQNAKFNAYINMKYIKDMEFVEATHKALSGLDESTAKMKSKVLHKAEDIILK